MGTPNLYGPPRPSGADTPARSAVAVDRGGPEVWLSLPGCLAHARYDFPLQMYSILF